MTMYPALQAGKYLTVSDALNQVLDLIAALELSETPTASERQVAWCLTEAYTNSPPFTIVMEPYPVHADHSISPRVDHVVDLFASEFRSLLEGDASRLALSDARTSFERILDRNLDGIERTDIQIDNDEPITVDQISADKARSAIARFGIDSEIAEPDWQRTEMGSVEGEICGLTKSRGKPALEIVERLSEKRFTCTLTDDLSKEIGPDHRWSEVWEGRLVSVTGTLHYNSAGELKRADIEYMQEIEWADIPQSRLQDVDILEGRTLSEHLNLLRGDSND